MLSSHRKMKRERENRNAIRERTEKLGEKNLLDEKILKRRSEKVGFGCESGG